MENAANPLSGVRVVCSGEFELVSRKKLEEIIKKFGATITSAVSGKTDYLIVGYKLEDGRAVTQGSKYARA
jgi:replication factor C subunit 1